jgi:RNA recognition motif-containing protein
MSSRHNDAGRRLFVGRLSLNTEDGVMRNYFERYGALSDCVVMRRPDTLQSRGFGFVTFVHPESLEQCMAVGSSSHWIDGRQVELSRATAKNPAKTFGGGGGNSGYGGGGRDAAKPILGDVEVDRRLFIGRLNFNTSDEALRDYFGRWGQLESGSVMRWPETLKSRGFGFVTFKYTQSMEQCLAHAGTHTLDGSEIVITRARNKVEGGASSAPGGAKRKWNDDDGDSDEPYDPESKALRRLFLGRLSFGTTDELVRDYFERFGPLEEINVMKFPDSGKSRGFGFITFEQAQSVDDCQAARPHALDGKIIEVKRATARRGDAKNSPEAMAEVKKLWVGGFTEETSDEDITEYFEQFGGRVLAVEQVRYGNVGTSFLMYGSYRREERVREGTRAASFDTIW